MAAGDAQAAAAFVRRYQSRVFGLALTIVGVPAVAEEVAQEAFVRAWRVARGGGPPAGGAGRLVPVGGPHHPDDLRRAAPRPPPQAARAVARALPRACPSAWE